jgi:hypothetical protein
MAIDGTIEDVADTPENARTFGRHSGDRGEGAFPQIQGVYLVECGTHAIVDAGFWPRKSSPAYRGITTLTECRPWNVGDVGSWVPFLSDGHQDAGRRALIVWVDYLLRPIRNW